MNMDRRNFLKTTSGLTAGLTLAAANLARGAETAAPSMMGYADKPMAKVRIGFVGYGMRGTGMLASLLKFENVEITAVCDLIQARADTAAAEVVKAGLPKPAVYGGGADEYKRLCARNDIDLVYICTPWSTHTPICLCAMENGKHAACEVPIAVTVDECWQLVETSERTRRHCMMLENCCYGETELFTLNLVRHGLLGETVHGECAYIHDLRALKFATEADGGYQGQWRLKEMLHRNGNLYPTHGLGPICQALAVNGGDRLDFLTSVSSGQFGITEYVGRVYGKDSPEAKMAYALGDMNTTLIRTVKGKTIMLQHDCTSPRPYSRINTLSGTDGISADYPPRLAIETNEKGAHEWMKPAAYTATRQKWEHRQIKRCGEIARQVGGHGGMDFLMDLRLCYCLQKGLPLDMDVYDAASWSCLVELTEKSTVRRGTPMDIPDFTRGGWKTAKPLDIVDVQI